MIFTGKKHVQMKLQCLKNSINMDIWVVGTSNHLSIRGSWTETKFSKKESISLQNPILCKRFIFHFPFHLSQHYLLTRQFCIYENITFSILPLLTKKRCSSFLKMIFDFMNFFSKLKYYKRSKYCDCLINMPISQMNG